MIEEIKKDTETISVILSPYMEIPEIGLYNVENVYQRFSEWLKEANTRNL